MIRVDVITSEVADSDRWLNYCKKTRAMFSVVKSLLMHDLHTMYYASLLILNGAKTDCTRVDYSFSASWIQHYGQYIFLRAYILSYGCSWCGTSHRIFFDRSKTFVLYFF